MQGQIREGLLQFSLKDREKEKSIFISKRLHWEFLSFKGSQNLSLKSEKIAFLE